MRRDGKVERLREIRSQTGFKLKLPWLVGIKKITRHALARPAAAAAARARACGTPLSVSQLLKLDGSIPII